MLDEKGVIIGYGGHAHVVADSYLSGGNSLDFYTDLTKVMHNPFRLEYLGNELDKDFRGWKMGLTFVLGIGDNKLRYKIGKRILDIKEKLDSVIDPSSIISNKSFIGSGVFISKGVLINSFSNLGDFSILNTGCIIEHDCIIEEAAHIGPSAVITGGVKIGKRTFIGANSVVKQGIVIGDDVLVGAGSVILNDVESGSKIAGNPAKLI